MPALPEQTIEEHQEPEVDSKHISSKTAAASDSSQNRPEQGILPIIQKNVDGVDASKGKIEQIAAKQTAGNAKGGTSFISDDSLKNDKKDNKLKNKIIAVLFVIAFAAIGYGDYEHIKYAASAKDDALRAAAGNSAAAPHSTSNTGDTPTQFMR
jgi:uncharacterized membrane protein YebE (DUF533 family)